MSRKVRTTISLDPEVLAVYRQMAEQSGMSLSQCIGGWLETTLDSAQFINRKMLEARGLPSKFVQSMQTLLDETQVEMDSIVSDMKNPHSAPSSNTGLKSRRKGVVNER